MTQHCVAVYVYGRVQGVGFRSHTQRQARALSLTGYVQNRNDGSVYLIACGTQQNIRRLLTWLAEEGPRNAVVERVSVEPKAPGDYQEFSLRY